jgi:hypothetical protein
VLGANNLAKGNLVAMMGEEWMKALSGEKPFKLLSGQGKYDKCLMFSWLADGQMKEESLVMIDSHSHY